MRERLELTLTLDPHSILDRADLPGVVKDLRARLSARQWAVLELLALQVAAESAVDRETRRQILGLPHS